MLSVYIMQCIILRLKNNRSSTVLLLQWCCCFRHWNTTHFFGTSCLVCRISTQVHLKKYICIVIFKYFETDRVDQQLNIIFRNGRLNPFVKCVKYLINHPTNTLAYQCWWLFYLLPLLCFTIPLKKTQNIYISIYISYPIAHLLHRLVNWRYNFARYCTCTLLYLLYRPLFS